MHTRRTYLFAPLTIRRLLIGCLLLSGGVASAQNTTSDPMQIDLPVPRRKVRHNLQVSVDPASKPIPPPAIIKPTPPPPTPSQLPPTPEEIHKKAVRQQTKEREQVADDRAHDRLMNIGKVVGFLLVIGVGVFAVTDIFRQIRHTKRTAALEEDYEDEIAEP